MHMQWGYQNLPLKWILNNTFKVDYIFNKTNYLQAKTRQTMKLQMTGQKRQEKPPIQHWGLDAMIDVYVNVKKSTLFHPSTLSARRQP